MEVDLEEWVRLKMREIENQVGPFDSSISEHSDLESDCCRMCRGKGVINILVGFPNGERFLQEHSCLLCGGTGKPSR